MKINEPVTNNEVKMKDGDFVVSTTDLKGRITSVNRTFVEISGFREDEVLGQSHNIVRHPHMPPEAFGDLWGTVKKDKPWTGLVKNRCKNGDFYWVVANVTPIRESGKTIGYMSVRTKPSEDQIRAAEALYAQVREGKAKLVQDGLVSRIKNHLASSVKYQFGAFALLISGVALVLELTVLPHPDGHINWSTVLATLGGVSLFGVYFYRRICTAMKRAVSTLQQIAEGRFDDWVEIRGHDEFSWLTENLKTVQIRAGYSQYETNLANVEINRITQALDNVQACVMITDPFCNVIYQNDSFKRFLQSNQAHIRTVISEFSVDSLTGKDSRLFSAIPGAGTLFEKQLEKAVDVELQVGEFYFRVHSTPIVDSHGVTHGAVMEWSDCYQERVTEINVKRVLSAVLNGDLSQRIDASDTTGFVNTLCQSFNELIELCNVVIGETQVSMNAMAQGDLTRKIDGNFQGTFGQLKADVNASIDKLTEIMEKINSSSQVVAAGAKEIAGGNHDLSLRTERQASNLEETASSMTELTSTVRANASNANDASSLATQANAHAEDGGKVVADAIQAMEAITESISRISSIIGVIDEIAFQTNLLALNASVEAARAGEQGRGFAVVASEVRNLAGRSAVAAREIKELIDDSVGKVEDGASLVNRSGDTLSAIRKSIREVSELIGGIAVASGEQSSGLEIINSSVNQMDEMTQQNAALVEEAAAASERIGNEAAQLNQLVTFFKLRTAANHHVGDTDTLMKLAS